MSLTIPARKNNGTVKDERAIYQEHFPLLKKVVWARKVDIEEDVDIIHRWMNSSHVRKFWHMAWPKEKIRAYLEEKLNTENFDPCVICIDDERFGYLEIYHPHTDPVGEAYDVQKGDYRQ